MKIVDTQKIVERVLWRKNIVDKCLRFLDKVSTISEKKSTISENKVHKSKKIAPAADQI